MRITFGPWGETLAEVADAARAAEEAGAEVVWVPELHRSATVSAAAVAQATRTAQVGTAVALAFTRSPMITALEALDLDELSGGRLVLGLGTGVQRLNEDWHHVDWGQARHPPARDGPQHPGLLGDLHERRADRPRRRARADADPRLPAALRRHPDRHPRLPGGDGTAADPAGRRDRRRLDLPRADVAGVPARPDPARARRRPGARRPAAHRRWTSSPRPVCPSTPTRPWRGAAARGWSASTRRCARTPTSSPSTTSPTSRPAVVEAFRSGRDAPAHSPTPSRTTWSPRSPPRGPATRWPPQISAYEGLADTVKLTPPTHGLAPADIRAAQKELIAVIEELDADEAAWRTCGSSPSSSTAPARSGRSTSPTSAPR